MEVKIKKLEQDFEPFTIEITVSSKADLAMLWHRFNMPMSEYTEWDLCKIKPHLPDVSAGDVFAELDRIACDMGLVENQDGLF
mgnify:CR=1 FL=1